MFVGIGNFLTSVVIHNW